MSKPSPEVPSPTTPSETLEQLDARDPWFRRFWKHYNQPFAGCGGCLATVLAILIILWLISMFMGWHWGFKGGG